MNRIAGMLAAVLVGCILGGCGSSRAKTVSDSPLRANSVVYKVAMEREVSVAFEDQASDSGDQRQTETLSFVCRIQPAGSGPSDSPYRYRLTFEDVAVRRADFLHELSSADPAKELGGKSFEMLTDNEGLIVEADELLKSITALARGCESCPQGNDCGQRKVREHNFLLDVWSIHELLFRSIAAMQKAGGGNEWKHTRQLPSVLPGEAPSVATEWLVEASDGGTFVAIGHETLEQTAAESLLPALHHPHVKPKGLLGFLRNCTYDSVKGHITLEAGGSDLPSRITREGFMNATAYYTLSRPPKKAHIEIWEKLTIEAQE